MLAKPRRLGGKAVQLASNNRIGALRLGEAAGIALLLDRVVDDEQEFAQSTAVRHLLQLLGQTLARRPMMISLDHRRGPMYRPFHQVRRLGWAAIHLQPREHAEHANEP